MLPRRERPKGRRSGRPERRRIKEMGFKGAFEALALKETYISGMRTPGHFHFMEKLNRAARATTMLAGARLWRGYSRISSGSSFRFTLSLNSWIVFGLISRHFL